MIKIKRYARLYRVFLSQFIKSIMQSKLDFFTGLFSFLLTQTSGIIFILLVFSQIPSLHGYSLNQIIFIYGFAQIPRGIDHLVTDNVWLLSFRMVIRGEFDRYLLRPMNLYFQIICERIQADAVGELLVGFALVIMSVITGTVSISFIHIVLFVVSIFAGAVIYAAIKLFYASLAFWMKDSSGILQIAYNLSNFAKYPTSIYAKPIQVILTLVVPFAIVSFYPTKYFMNLGNIFSTILLEIVIAVFSWCLAYGVFVKGTMIYESAGN